MIENDYFGDCNFTFEDEFNLNYEMNGKRRENYCDTFRIRLYDKIIILKLLKKKIAENSILINEKQPDDWKKYVIQNMEYQRILIEVKNKWNKIIEKHKDNMFINGINHDKLCCKIIKDYHELMTGSRRF